MIVIILLTICEFNYLVSVQWLLMISTCFLKTGLYKKAVPRQNRSDLFKKFVLWTSVLKVQRVTGKLGVTHNIVLKLVYLIYESLNMKNDSMNVMWILEPEHGVVVLKENEKPEDRVESALKCLPHYDPASRGNMEPASSFQYWKIRDYAHAYRSGLVTPSVVCYCY